MAKHKKHAASKQPSKGKGVMKWGYRLLFFAHLCLYVLLCLSGFNYLLNPTKFPWLVSLGLMFGGFLAANIVCTLFWLFVKRKYFWIGLASLVICLSPIRTFCPINIPTIDIPDSCLKVVSYNVCCFRFPDTLKSNKIQSYIQESDADILCLQEYYSNKWRKKDIDSITSQWKYMDTCRFINNVMAIYSHYPIIDKCIVSCGDKLHGAIIYRLNINNKKVAVVNCHFNSNELTPSDKQKYKSAFEHPVEDSTKTNALNLLRKVNIAGVKRAEQAEQLIAQLRKLGDMPIILCGDLNDSPISYAHGVLTNHLNDTYTRSGNGYGMTYHEAGMYFRLDNILCSHHFKSLRSIVNSNIDGSDHYPIKSWLQYTE